MNESAPPRLVSDLVFPPYTYVPGRFPHPITDPKGHSFGITPPPCEPPDPDRWQECRPYLVGIELFNHGYYWEAHEVWESVWHACGRKGITADFLKGLINLAAAGVKVRQRQPEGVRHHARRAAELFAGIPRAQSYMGLSVDELILRANYAADCPPSDPGRHAEPVVVFSFVLWPGK
jgi:uncharacterized protein